MAQKIVYSANFKCNYVAVFAIVLFLLMIAGEIALAVSIPVYMTKENVLSEEVRLRETLLSFDNLRRACNSVNSSDEVVMLEKQLISTALDQMAFYLRSEADRMTPDEVNELASLTNELYRVVSKLQKKIPFSQEKRLDSAVYIDALVKKYSAKGRQ